MSVSDILAKAADLIEPEGAWSGGCVHGRDCAATAIWQANGNFGDSRPTRPAQRFFAKQIGVNPSRVPSSIYCWNDDPSRTQSEVVAKLREASQVAKERGL